MPPNAAFSGRGRLHGDERLFVNVGTASSAEDPDGQDNTKIIASSSTMLGRDHKKSSRGNEGGERHTEG